MVVPFMLVALSMLGSSSYYVTSKEHLLENDQRKDLFELTQKVPGITPAAAQRHLGCPKSNLYHHVRVLVAQDCLRRVCLRRSVHLFPVGTPHVHEVAVLMGRNMLEFAKAVVERPDTNLADISKRTGTDRKVLRGRAGALVQAGLVEDRGTETRHSYWPTALLVIVLERVAAIMAAERDLVAERGLAAKKDLGTVHATASEARPDG